TRAPGPGGISTVWPDASDMFGVRWFAHRMAAPSLWYLAARVLTVWPGSTVTLCAGLETSTVAAGGRSITALTTMSPKLRATPCCDADAAARGTNTHSPNATASTHACRATRCRHLPMTRHSYRAPSTARARPPGTWPEIGRQAN